MRVLAWIAAALLALAPLGAVAQGELSMGQVRSPVLTIDVERLLAETRFGRRLSQDLRERTEALAAENEALRVRLTEEERALTERRPSMEVESFRAEAEAFDARVQRIRAEQDAKQRALEAAVGEGREAFLNAATPVLARLMIDSGAAVILERRDVFLSAGLIDVTDEAIAAIDEALGDGQGTEEETRPDPAAAEAPEEPALRDPAPAEPESEDGDREPSGATPAPEAPAGD